jgi:hypothetical protein
MKGAPEELFLVNVTYMFKVEGGATKAFTTDVDLRAAEPKRYSPTLPEWTKLDHCKCAHCPLSSDSSPHCPAAVSITDIVEFFADHSSSAPTTCRVDTTRRSVAVRRSLQECLYPLVGLRLATSKCPVLKPLAPMARFHEPFASPLYTVYRALSLHLMRQYFEGRELTDRTWDLDALKEQYTLIHQVNVKMAERLAAAEVLDAAANSLAVLSVFDTSMTYFFDHYVHLRAGLFAGTEAPWPES